MSKNIQISSELWDNIISYFLISDEQKKYYLEQDILNGISKKLDAMIKHDLYSKYKTAPTDEQREEARKQYLDKIGMHKDFRY